MLIKIMWHWHKNRHRYWENRTESPEINPHTYGQMIFNKSTKTVKWRRNSLSNKWYWENWIAILKKKKKMLNSCITPYTKVNSKLANFRTFSSTPKRNCIPVNNPSPFYSPPGNHQSTFHLCGFVYSGHFL